MKYKIKYLLIVLLLLSFTPVQAWKLLDDDQNTINTTTTTLPVITDSKVYVEDDADLLTPEEEAELRKTMEQISTYGTIIFKSIDANPYGTTSNAANNILHEHINNYESGTIFLIDMYRREIYIYSDGEIYETITSAKAYTITDNVYKYATRGDYFGCANNAFKQMNSLLNGQKIAEPMKYISNAILSLVLGSFITFLISRRSSLKDNTKSNTKYINKSFSIGDVTGTKSGQTRVYSPVSDSSSGGSSGGGGGGGGGSSSGGGGGHSF